LASSALDQALPQDCVVFGEISLSGDVRPVSRMDARMKEAAKLGFRQALGPSGLEAAPGMRPVAAGRLSEAIARIGEADWPAR
jgi:DNA repair protein RadA/Sms